MDKNNINLSGKSKQFDEKLTAIKSQFFSALDDYKKYYVYYNKNPEVSEFQNYYASSKGQLQSMNKELLKTTNSIYRYVETLNETTVDVSKQIEEAKKLNEEMMSQRQFLESTQNGSVILIDDAKVDYNRQYYKNVELIIGTILLGIIISNTFGPLMQTESSLSIFGKITEAFKPK